MRTLDRSTTIRLTYLLLALAIALESCGTTRPELLPLNAQPAADDGTPVWSYSGVTAPDAWGRLSPEFAFCSYGQMQSPIDLSIAERGDVAPIRFHYANSRAVIRNTGHTVQASFDPGNWIELNGVTYRLVEFHYHHPSEHLVRGAAAPIEVHLVHQNDTGEYAVVGILFDRGAAQNPALRRMLAVDPDASDVQPVTHINPGDLLPPDRHYVTYDGSLTTPPCTEGVKWVVFANPGIMSPQQADKLNDLVPPNARPLQSLRARTVITSGKVSRE
jgi:carbonic anhydrase